ncbi:hypothetical protein CH341_29505 [Rhodoplanes roseus]|uniref:Secretin/TonB short N-terminal domain-containing protein n=1 Tax=Rhodoplanes roseus TaxID=29409 RepID=A0A327KIQ6_9BRAD|nr:hypothetical protein CH341_29505 [Rhodoplanes roseus]
MQSGSTSGAWSSRRARIAALVLSVSPLIGLVPLSAAHAQAASEVEFAIPAGRLDAALTAFGRQTGLQVTYLAAAGAGQVSPGFAGRATPGQALERLLAGTGLVHSFPNARTVSVAAPLAPGGAFAAAEGIQLDQISVEGQGSGVDGVVATRSEVGTKTDTPIIEVPQTINVVTRQEMDDRGVVDFNSAVAYTPGILVTDYPGGQGMPDIYLRGFRATQQESSYRDGLRNGFNAYDTDIETYGLERIDVLKGPASVLYGQGTPGGIVDMTSKRPTTTPYHEVQVQGGSFDRKQVAVDFSGPVPTDPTLFYRLTALWRDSGTQIDHSPDDRVYIAPALTWKPSQWTSLTLLTSYQKSKKGGAEQSLPMDNTIFDNGPKIPSSLFLGVPGMTLWKTENASVGYEFKHAFDNVWKFNQNFRYTHSKVDYTSGWIWDWPTALSNGHYANIGVQARPKDSDAVLVDNNMRGEFATGPFVHKVVFGVDYSYYRYHETRTNSTNYITIDIFDPIYDASALTLGTPWVDESQSFHQLGFYAQDQIKLDRWILSLGGRHDAVNSDTLDRLSGTTTTTDDRAFTYRAGLGYLFDNGVAPYVSYSTSFNPVVGTDYSGSPFKPTTGEQYEAGVKYQPVGINGMITASVFQITQQNVTTADPDHLYYSTQDGEVRSRGFEIEGKIEPWKGFNVVAGYSYTDARITQDNPETVGGYSKVGLRQTAVPYHKASLWLDYRFQDPALQGLKVGTGVRYIGSSMAPMDTSTGTQVEVPGYTLLDAAISYDLGQKFADLKGVTLSVTGTNLTDEIYFTPGFYSNTVFYGNRRSVIGTMSYKW